MTTYIKLFKITLFASLYIAAVIFIITYFIYGESVKHFQRTDPNEFIKKPLTIHCNRGRLGNQMSTYATLYGIARHNNRTPYGQFCNMKHLTPYFDVTAKVIPDMAAKDMIRYDIIDYLREEDLHIQSSVNIITGFLYPQSYTFHHQFKTEILKEFSFKKHINTYAENILRNVVKNHSYETFVGMHIRRGDFCIILKKFHGRPFDMKYLSKAMTYFRKKYKDVVFIVVSDDRKWCHKNLGKMNDVIIPPTPPEAVYDIAVLANCNHTIITYGSYGYWGAYLADGETIYFKGNYAPDSLLYKKIGLHNDSKPPGWIGISTTPKDYWKTHKWDKCRL